MMGFWDFATAHATAATIMVLGVSLASVVGLALISENWSNAVQAKYAHPEAPETDAATPTGSEETAP